MTVLNVVNLVKEFQGEAIFKDVNFTISEKDRLAIIGPNGTGKTTILKMILGLEEITQGSITFGKGVNVGYLSQEVIQSEDNTLLEEALLVFKDVIALEQELKDLEEKISLNPEDTKLIDTYGKKQTYFINQDGYSYRYLVEMMLGKFGFSKEEFNRPINSFSGGEKTKMSFVKLLLLKPQLLILDEPTNHLDVVTIEWLENYLKSYEGSLLFVSHDRYFINALANKIIELDNKTSERYKGNYDYYVEEKKLRIEQALRDYTIQQKEIAKLKRFIEYFMPKPRFVSRAKDRQKKLERINVLEKPKGPERAIKLGFKGEILEGKKLLSFSHLTLGYNTPLIKDINFTLFGKDKLAIMGNNGTGKTTLLKLLLNQLKPMEGEVVFLRKLKIGYIDQHHFDIRGSHNLVESVKQDFPEMGEKEIYNHLGKFNFEYDDMFKAVDVLSGGEKMRLLLAKIILKEYDLLLLDEPTNHLDMVTKQALTIALRDYQGSIIFVSHDRYFVDEIANKVLYIANGLSYYHEGNYQDFKEEEIDLFENNESPKEVKKEVARVKKATVSLGKLEEKIKSIEAQLDKIKKEEFLEENYMDSKKMKELHQQQVDLQSELEELENLYLERLND